MNVFKEKAKNKVMDYQEYTNWVNTLVENKKTSGENQSEALVDFTSLNQRRMNRINKTLKLNENLVSQLKNAPKQNWWVITEAWCGDGAQNLPVIGKMAEASEGKIDLKIIIRDYNPELMQKYLTNGGASIPKLVAFSEERKELFTWGPRPETVKELLLDWKANPEGRSRDDFEIELHTWYARNKSVTIQDEFMKLI